MFDDLTFCSFWPSLLADAIPLLEGKEQHFSSKETYVILHHLEHQMIPLIEKKKRMIVSGKATSLNLLNDCRIEHVDEIVKLLRLSCARNLARSLINENTFVWVWSDRSAFISTKSSVWSDTSKERQSEALGFVRSVEQSKRNIFHNVCFDEMESRISSNLKNCWELRIDGLS